MRDGADDVGSGAADEGRQSQEAAETVLMPGTEQATELVNNRKRVDETSEKMAEVTTDKTVQ